MAMACSAVMGGATSASAKPFRLSLTGDDFDGETWRTGIRVELSDDWKTYWRMPGDAGIPPIFAWNGEADHPRVRVLYPLPRRFNDASGETVGYKHEVVFPVIVKPGEQLTQSLRLEAFFAVCREICIPVQATAEIGLGTAVRDPSGSELVEAWMRRVPMAGQFVSSARLDHAAGKPALILSLSRAMRDIFVEVDGSAYFRAPGFNGDGREATIAIDNISDPAALRGKSLTLTGDDGASGLEQTIALS